MHKRWQFPIDLRYSTMLCVFAVLVSSGCATIRKLNPIESQTLEARRLTQQAIAAVHESEWADAEQKLVRAIERNPDDNRARDVLADVLWERGAQRAAVEQKSRSILISGRQDPMALTELGQMQLTIGNAQAALQRTNVALAEDSNFADAWTLRGFALQALGRPEEALSAFFRSLSVRDGDPRTRLEIAKIYRETGQFRRALAILGTSSKENLANCPHFGELCYLRGVLFNDLNRPVDAMSSLVVAQENGCQRPDLTLYLADAQIKAGEGLLARATLADAEARATTLDMPPEYKVALESLQKRLGTPQPGAGHLNIVAEHDDADTQLR